MLAHVGLLLRRGAVFEAGRGTYAIGEVCDQIINLNFPVLKLAVQPAATRLAVQYQRLAVQAVGDDARTIL